MPEISTCVDDAIELLSGIAGGYALQEELQFLRTFLLYIPQLIEVDENLRQHLGRAVDELKDAIEDLSSALEEASDEGKESLSALCSNLKENMEFFKPKILQVYQSLLDLGVRRRSSIDIATWDAFMESVRGNMWDLARRFEYGTSLKDLMDSLHERLLGLKIWMSKFSKDNPSNFIDLWIHVESLVISAAHLSCFCWVEKGWMITNDKFLKLIADFEPRLRGGIPEITELYLTSFLRNPGSKQFVISFAAGIFLGVMFPYSAPETYRKGLEFLVMFLLNTYEDDVEFIFADIRSVLMEAATIDYSRDRIKKDYPALLQFPEKIELLKAEVFLMELLKCGSKANMQKTIPIESLRSGLAALQNLRKRRQKKDPTGKMKQLLMNIEIVFADIESHHRSLETNGRTKDHGDVLKLLLLIKLLKAEVFLMELLKDKTDFKDENLHQDMKILRDFLSRPPQEKSTSGNRKLARVEEVAREVLLLYHNFPAGQETGDRAREMKVSISKLLEVIKLVVAETVHNSGRVPRSSPFIFPETNGSGFVDYFLDRLKQPKNRGHLKTDYLKTQIRLVIQKLEPLRSFVSDATKLQEWNYLSRNIVDLAYEADYAIDSIALGNGSQSFHMALLSDVIEELKFSNREIEEKYAIQARTVAVTRTPTVSAVGTPNTNFEFEKDLLDRKDQEETIRKLLLGRKEDRQIALLVGPGGLGKSTLAKKVYDDLKDAKEFDVCAWVSVPEVYRKEDLLLGILKVVREPTKEDKEKTWKQIAHLLKQNLSEKRYLIVLDNFWDSDAWNDLERSFPKGKLRSRILITTRQYEAAMKIKGGIDPDPYQLPPLSPDQSWKLLEKKVFDGKGCQNSQLENYGKRIAEGCDGLPLAIVAVAGILKQQKEVELWKKISEEVSRFAAVEGKCKDILQVSYNHLPDELKPCFLYLGAFLEDKEIPARKVLKLWTAEGFIRKDDPEVAEDYLRDLISRSLVTPSEEKSQGGIKTCRVHSILSQMCRSVAEKEHFLQPITKYDEHFRECLLDSGVDFEFPVPSIKYEQHRLCIYSKRNHFAMLKPSGPPVRSLLLFPRIDENPDLDYDISFVAHKFKLLRVLDLESICTEPSFLPQVVKLKMLRYLAVCGNINCIPEAIADLWDLETFIVKGKNSVKVPEDIWGMQNLKHFLVEPIFRIQSKPKKSSNLVRLSAPSFSCGETAEEIIKRLQRLQKLRCRFSKSQGHSGNCNRSPIMSFLKQLESLNVSYYGEVPRPCEFGFPSTLKKLSLSNIYLPKSYISMIGMLPGLKVLKLLSVTFDDQKWEMDEEEELVDQKLEIDDEESEIDFKKSEMDDDKKFRELEYLKIENSGIVHWSANEDQDHLPKLRRLVLQRCNQLEKVPLRLWLIDSLERIEVQWCSQSVRDSLEKIDKKKRDANQTFELLVTGV